MLIRLVDNNPRNLTLILMIFSWPFMARQIRMVTLQQGVMDYVKASKTLGTPNIVIIFREVVPNVVSFMVVNLTLMVASSMGIETGLTILGFGLNIRTPSLGLLIQNAMEPFNMQNRPWQWLPAAFLILVMTLCINYVGQAVNRAADARRRRV
jgi:peptide/nickel transport system permease protein